MIDIKKLYQYYNISQESLLSSKKAIEQASNIVLLPHSKADSDAMGSAFAIKLALHKINKKSFVVTPDAPSIEYFKDFHVAKSPVDPDLLISVDCGGIDRTFRPQEWVDKKMINIDHHASNNNFGTINVVDSNAASNCELVFLFLAEIFGEDVFDQEVCEAILLGIISDTCNFKTNKVSAGTLMIASYLIEKGANRVKLSNLVESKLTHQVMSAWCKIFLQAEKPFKNESLIIFKMDQKFVKENRLEVENFSGFINFFGHKISFNVSAFVVEVEPKKVKVSLRSRSYDVNELAKKFNGGGHVAAAGFSVDNSDVETVAKLIKERF